MYVVSKFKCNICSHWSNNRKTTVHAFLRTGEDCWSENFTAAKLSGPVAVRRQPGSFSFQFRTCPSKIWNPRIKWFSKSGLGSYIRSSAKGMRKARWLVIGDLRPCWMNFSTTKSHHSPDQAQTYNENGTYTAIQRHTPYNCTLSAVAVRCLSNRELFLPHHIAYQWMLAVV